MVAGAAAREGREGPNRHYWARRTMREPRCITTKTMERMVAEMVMSNNERAQQKQLARVWCLVHITMMHECNRIYIVIKALDQIKGKKIECGLFDGESAVWCREGTHQMREGSDFVTTDESHIIGIEQN